MGKVYVTQIPHRRKVEGGPLVPAINLNPAAEHGEIVVMFPPDSTYFGTAETTKLAQEFIKNFNENEDCFLPLGDPVLCTICSGQIAKRTNFATVLKWDKNLGRYTKNRVIF